MTDYRYTSYKPEIVSLHGDASWSTQTSSSGSGQPPYITAVGAPAGEPYEDLFAVLDRMEISEIADFVEALKQRYPVG